VYALYDFYQKQLEENNNEAVVATTALARLPSHIHYSIHDVAHLFRKLLHGLPGGLLGSPSVFQALYNIHRFVYPDPSLGGHMTKKVKPRMIALAISSVNLHFRIALICAVFGLLRAITLASEQEVETKVKDPHEMFAQIKEDALGIVFGPLLLGDKSDHILTEDLEDRGGLLVLPEVDPAGQITPKRSKSKSKIDIGYNKKQLEKTRRAAMVCQMLIDNWEDICYQMKRINTLSATAQAYDLPAQSGGEFRYVSEPSKKETMRDNSRQQTIRSQKSTQRSTGTQRSTRPPEESVKHKHHSIHGHHISMPSFHGHHFHAPHTPDLPDLMRFSTRSSNDQDVEEPFSVPLITQQRTEMTPIVEMTPDRSLASPSTQESETSPNWRIRTEMTPIVEMTPVRSFITPSIQEPETSPNWRIIAPDEMETPTTPTRRYDINFKDPVMDRISLDHHSMDQESMHRRSVSSSSRGSSRLFGPSSSPPMEVLAEAAIRPRRELAPPFEESMVEESSVTEDDPESRNESMEPESPDQRSAFGRRVISRVPELSPQSEDTPGPEEEPNRPITPKPLSFRKKTTGSFSIFEDGEADKTPRAQQLPVDSPILTLTKPNSRGEIKLNPKGTRSSPTRAPPESPTRPQSVPLQPATPNRRPRASTMESDFEDRFLWDLEGETPSPKKLRGNSALYAEIRRLQRLVDAKNEEAMSTRKELELAKSMANAGTLSHLVRETQEELKVWKNRAEWAEKQLRERGIMGGRLQSAAPMVKGHAHRYSVS